MKKQRTEKIFKKRKNIQNRFALLCFDDNSPIIINLYSFFFSIIFYYVFLYPLIVAVFFFDTVVFALPLLILFPLNQWVTLPSAFFFIVSSEHKIYSNFHHKIKINPKKKCPLHHHHHSNKTPKFLGLKTEDPSTSPS